MISSSTGPRDQLLDLSPCQNFDLSMGYRQVKSEPTMFVVLSYSWLIPREYTLTSFGLTNAITVFTWWWKSSDTEIPMSCYWAHQQHLVSSMIHVERLSWCWKLVQAYLHALFMKYLSGWKKWLPLVHVQLMQVAAVNSRKIVFVSSSTIPSQLCMCECILWFGRLITSTPFVFPSTPSHWLICSRKRSSFLRARLIQGLQYPRWWFPTWTR